MSYSLVQVVNQCSVGELFLHLEVSEVSETRPSPSCQVQLELLTYHSPYFLKVGVEKKAEDQIF